MVVTVIEGQFSVDFLLQKLIVVCGSYRRLQTCFSLLAEAKGTESSQLLWQIETSSGKDKEWDMTLPRTVSVRTGVSTD